MDRTSEAGRCLGRFAPEVKQWHVLCLILLLFVTSAVATKASNSACESIQKPIDADVELGFPAKKKTKLTLAEYQKRLQKLHPRLQQLHLIDTPDEASTPTRPLTEVALIEPAGGVFSAASKWSAVEGHRSHPSRPTQETTPAALIATTNRVVGLPLNVDSKPPVESQDTTGFEPNAVLNQPAKIKSGDFRASVGGMVKALPLLLVGLLVGLLGVYAWSHGLCMVGSPCVASAASDLKVSNGITAATSTEDVRVLPN